MMANLEDVITEVIKPIEALLGTYGDSGLAAEAMYPKLRQFTPAELRAATNKTLSEWTQRTKKPLAADISKAVATRRGKGGEFDTKMAERAAELERIVSMGLARRAGLEAKYGAERVVEARDFNEKWGIERSWLSLERTLLNWDLIQDKVMRGTWCQ